RALSDSPQGFSEVAGAADKGSLKLVLVDVVALVSRGEHLALVDEVDAERLKDLRFNKVADARFGHHGDAHRFFDGEDHLWIGHAGDTAGSPDIRGHPFEGHHRHSSSVLGDFGLLNGGHIHNDAASKRLGDSQLRLPGPVLRHGRLLPRDRFTALDYNRSSCSSPHKLKSSTDAVFPRLLAVPKPA